MRWQYWICPIIKSSDIFRRSDNIAITVKNNFLSGFLLIYFSLSNSPLCRWYQFWLSGTFVTNRRRGKKRHLNLRLWVMHGKMDWLALLDLRSALLSHRLQRSNQMVLILWCYTSQRLCRYLPTTFFLTKKSTSILRCCIVKKWWWKMDSNHRSRWQQIYSLPPLAAREFHHSVIGAGRGSRTPMTSLEGWCTAVMPYPQNIQDELVPTVGLEPTLFRGTRTWT